MQFLSGFVDVHVHLNGPAGLESARSSGISAVRDAGMRQNSLETGRKPVSRQPNPLFVSSRWALYKKGGYGSRFGLPVETRSDIRTEIARLKQAGADIIKVIASGIVSLADPGSVTSGGFDRAELQFLVEESARSGLAVMAHANSEPAILAAAESGVRSIEHGFFMTERALHRLAENRVFWTPTVGALVRAAQKAEPACLFIQDLVTAHLQMMKHAHLLGVPLAIGTDCVLPDASYADAYRSELFYFEKAGIPRTEVLEIARNGGARLLGVNPGK